MADRKLQYIIEMIADDNSLRKQMKGWNWEDIMGQSKGNSFKDVLVKDTKEAKQEIVNTLGNMGLDWGKILGEKEFKQLETKVGHIIKANKDKLAVFANEGDTAGIQKTIDLVSALGNELKGLGSNFDASGIARNISAFMKVLTPISAKMEQLAKEPEKVATAFDRMFSGTTTAMNNVAQSSTNVINVFARMDAALKSTGGLEKQKKNLEVLYDLLSSDPNASFPDFSKMSVDQLLKEVERLDKLWDDIDKKANYGAYTSQQQGEVAKIEAQLVHINKLLPDGKKVLVPIELGGQKYGASAEDYLKDIQVVADKAKQSLSELNEQIEKSLGESFAQTISKQISDIKLSVSLSDKEKSKFINEINTFVQDINKTPLEKVKIGVGQVLDDVSNPIENKLKRAYGNNPADEDAETTKLVNKTKDRFDRVGSVIRSKQSRILHNTKTWRKNMIEAMQIGANELQFNFGWDGHLKDSADSLFNKLQEYFEQPENALNVYFDTKNIAKNLKAELDAEGITIGGSGGTATLDANSLASALYSVLLGQVPSGFSSGESESYIPDNLEEETDEAVASGQEYVKVLDETTIHIDKVIKSLREFAKVATKSNASQSAKDIAKRLFDKGIDVDRIKNGANDIDIITMLQKSLMTKDEMGIAVGTSLPAELKNMRDSLKMNKKSGAGKIVEILAQDIIELFNINDIETELIEQVEKRLNQLDLWKGIEKPGRALASLGKVRSTKKAIKIPTIEDLDQAIKYFGIAGEDIGALDKLKEARIKLGDNDSEEAKQEFEQAAKVFYEETKTVFNRLRAQFGNFKGIVQAENRKPVKIDPQGAYPYKILEVPEDAVIVKVDPIEAFAIVDNGGVGSSSRKESSIRKAEQQQKQMNYGSSGLDILVDKPKPKKDVRYENIEYDVFKPQETIKLPPNSKSQIEALKNQADEVPELINRINEGVATIADLEETRRQLEADLEKMKIEGLPNIKLNAFKQYDSRKSSIDNFVKNAKNALTTSSTFELGDMSELSDGESFLSSELHSIITNIHNDSATSQELANQISEIEEAQKLSKEDLEYWRNQAANIAKLQNDKSQAQREIQSLKNRTDIKDDIRDNLIAQQKSKIEASDNSISSLMELFNGRTIDPNFYRDLLFNKSDVDRRVIGYKTKKDEVDSRLNKSRDSAQTIINQLNRLNDTNGKQATQEAAKLATQLIEVKERLYAEASEYVKILNNPATDENTRQSTLGKLQQTLRELDRAEYNFATIQPYIPQELLYTNAQQKNVDSWNKTYTDKETIKLERELKDLNKKLKEEENQDKIKELKKQIANTKRHLTILKNNKPDNVVNKTQSNLSTINQRLDEERKALNINETRKNTAEKATNLYQDMQKDVDFLTRYNELLAKEKSLLEEVNKLKKESADKSVVSAKTNELNQVTKELDNFLKAEQTEERFTYAREAAVGYAAQLKTAYRQRKAFDKELEDLETEKNSIDTYGMRGRTGARALRRTKRYATQEFMTSDYVQSQEQLLRDKAKTDSEKVFDPDAKNKIWEQYRADVTALRQRLRTEFEAQFDLDKELKARQQELTNIEKIVTQAREEHEVSKGTANETEALNNLNDQIKKRNEIYDKIKELESSLEQFNKGILSVIFKIQDESGNWTDDVRSYNIKEAALQSIEKEKAVAEQSRKPLDDIIGDLEAQKKAAMRYGVVSNEDLSNDDRLKEIETLNGQIEDDYLKIERLKKKIETLKSDESLAEKVKANKIKKEQKEIDTLNQEIASLETRIQNRTELITRKHQEKEDSRLTPEEKAANATEKLATQKERLSQIEEKIAQRRAEYESAKGTEDEMKNLELLDLEIKKRDELLGKIKTTEDNITRWNDQARAQQQASYATSGIMPEGGLLGSILSPVMSVLEGLGAGVEINTEELAKEATLRAILEVLGGVPSGDDGYGLGRGKNSGHQKAKRIDEIAQDSQRMAEIEASVEADLQKYKDKQIKTARTQMAQTIYDVSRGQIPVAEELSRFIHGTNKASAQNIAKTGLDFSAYDMLESMVMDDEAAFLHKGSRFATVLDIPKKYVQTYMRGVLTTVNKAFVKGYINAVNGEFTANPDFNPDYDLTGELQAKMQELQESEKNAPKRNRPGVASYGKKSADIQLELDRIKAFEASVEPAIQPGAVAEEVNENVAEVPAKAVVTPTIDTTTSQPDWISKMSEEERKTAVSSINKYDKKNVDAWKQMDSTELVKTIQATTQTMDGLNKESVEYLQKQRELGSLLNIYKEKSDVKDRATVTRKDGNTYIDPKKLVQEDPLLKSLGLYDKYAPITGNRAVKDMFAMPKQEIVAKPEIKEAEATLQIKDFDEFKLQAQALKQAIETQASGSEEQKKMQAALVQVLQAWARSEVSGFGGKLPSAEGWKAYLTQTGVFDSVDTSITPLTNRQLNKGTKVKDVVTDKPAKQDKKEAKSGKKTESHAESKQPEARQATGGLIQLVSRLATENTLLQVLNALQTVGTVEGGKSAPTAAGDLYNQFKALLLGGSIDDHERLAYMNSETGVMSGNIIGNIANISDELIRALRAKYPTAQGFDTQIHTHGKATKPYFSTEDYNHFTKDYESGIKKQVLLTKNHVSVLDLSAVKSAEEVQALMDELIKAGNNAKAIKKVFENNKSGALFESAKFDNLNVDSLVKMIGAKGVNSKGTSGKTYAGNTVVNSVNSQRNKIVGMFDSEDDFNASDIGLVRQYNKAVQDLNTTYQELDKNQQLQDENQQKALSQQASRVKALGKHLMSSIDQSRQLQQYVDQTGTYIKNGEAVELGGKSGTLSVDEIQNLEATMRNYVQNTLGQANIEHVKFNSTKQQLIYTFRTSKDTVADMVVQYNDATKALYAYNKQERESLTGWPAFIQGMKSKIKSITQYMFSITSITRVWGEVRKGIQYIREIDSALTELKKVTDATEETYDKFLDTAAKTADKVGSTIKEVVSSTADFARLNI